MVGLKLVLDVVSVFIVVAGMFVTVAVVVVVVVVAFSKVCELAVELLLDDRTETDTSEEMSVILKGHKTLMLVPSVRWE